MPWSDSVIDRYVEGAAFIRMLGWLRVRVEMMSVHKNYIYWKIVFKSKTIWKLKALGREGRTFSRKLSAFLLNISKILFRSLHSEIFWIFTRSALSNLSEFNCPETFSLLFVTQQWIDKRERNFFLSCRKCLRNLWCMHRTN